MLYGVNPLPDTRYPVDLKPVMQLEAQVIGTKTIEAGETVGYNETWRAERTTQLAFIAAGYADGYPITLQHQACVAFQSQRLPIVGRVSMDTLAIDCSAVDLSNTATPAVGDWVELWGNTIRVSEIARCAGTIPYQLLTQVSTRVKRIYQ